MHSYWPIGTPYIKFLDGSLKYFMAALQNFASLTLRQSARKAKLSLGTP
jgi:hypothetical protein